MSVPDYTLEDTLDFKFTTRRFSTGVPFAFVSGAIEIYEDNSVTQITGAETLTLEFDGVAGLHNLRVAATAANGFENGKSYHCVVSAGTVDSVSVVGEVVQQFSIGRSAAAVDAADMQPIVQRLAYMGPYGLGVWCDDAAANTNTVLGTDGTEDNPVSTLTAARTIADALGSKTYYIEGGSSFTLGATHEDWLFVGHGDADSNTINLGAAASATDVDRSEFINLTVVGTQGGAERIALERCVIDDAPTAEVTTLHCLATFCDLQGNFQIDTSNDNVFADCYSGVAGNATPVLTFTGASGDLEFRRYSGGIELKSAGASHTASMDFTSGHLVINADVNVNAAITWRGVSHITDNTAGLNSLTKTGALNVDEILDEATAGHTTAGTVGKAIIDILADTNELQSDDVPGLIGALNDISATDVNGEVVDVLKTDTITLPGQLAPPLTPTFEQALSWLYKAFRNRKDETATLWQLYADNETTVDAKATVSDDATTAIKQEIVSGP